MGDCKMLRQISAITLTTAAITFNAIPIQALPKTETFPKNWENTQQYFLAQNNVNFYMPTRRPGQVSIGAKPAALVIGIRGHEYGNYDSRGFPIIPQMYIDPYPENSRHDESEYYDILEIQLEKDSKGNSADTVVQIYDLVNEVDYKLLYMYPGGVATVKIPPGTYEIKCAIGKSWVSESELFGENTYYFKLDKQIISAENRTQQMKYTLILNTRIDPDSQNAVAQETITPEEFEPKKEIAEN